MIDAISFFRKQYQGQGLNKKTIRLFQKIIKSNYQKNKRDLPWRKNKNPYRVFVSEVMLQQTQVPRVIEKYASWMKKFPNFEALNAASVAEILKVWQGMGYNRRALFLKKAAQMVVSEYKGRLPSTENELRELPGIGPATAASILCFAFNKPTIFIETNIRSVYLHFFFHSKKNINDSKIKKNLEKTIDYANPSDWYNALMDYGTLLKKEFGNPNKASKHYLKQSRFLGSNRELRGMILKLISSNNMLTLKKIQRLIKKDRMEIQRNLDQLEKEGFLREVNGKYILAS